MYALISGFIDLPAYAVSVVQSRRVAALFGPTIIFESFVPLLPLLPLLPLPPPLPIALPSFVNSNSNSLPLSILNSESIPFLSFLATRRTLSVCIKTCHVWCLENETRLFASNDVASW
jgi:hypothetical protein